MRPPRRPLRLKAPAVLLLGAAGCALPPLGGAAAGPDGAGGGAGSTGDSPPCGAEVCDGRDNDCDGLVDDGCACLEGARQACHAGPDSTAGQGLCVAGVQACERGAWGPCIGEVLPAPEACNGVDDDCDGSVDEGEPGGGAACDTMGLGVCSPGVTHCSSGAIVCQASASPSPEVCNGLDDDCDGQVDEGDPGGGAACDSGELGVCSSGVAHCVSGALACVPDMSASAETCNGLDDDCDGSVDEAPVDAGAPCACGGVVGCAFGALSCGSIPFAWSLPNRPQAHVIPRDVFAMPTGEVIVAGEAVGTVDLGDGPIVAADPSLWEPSGFVAKYAADGTFLWSRGFDDGLPYNKRARAVVADAAGHVYVAVTGSAPDIYGWPLPVAYVFQLGPDGAPLTAWDLCFDCIAEGLGIDADGHLRVATKQYTLLELWKLDPSGVVEWSVEERGAQEYMNHVPHVGVDADGSSYVAVNDVAEWLELGGAHVALPAPDYEGGYVWKIDTNGGVVWSRPMGQYANPVDLAMTPSGGVALTGRFLESLDLGGASLVSAAEGDVYVLELDAGGALIWGKQLGNAFATMPTGLAVDASGRVLLAGTSTGELDLGGAPIAGQTAASLFVEQLDPAGGHLATWSFGASRRTAIAASCDGAPIVAGQGVPGDLGGGARPPGAFVARLAPPPADCGPGSCTNGSYCDACSCLPPTDPLSVLACACGVADPLCGRGSCQGTQHCDGGSCQSPGCSPITSPASLVLCGGGSIDPSCTTTAPAKRVFVTSASYGAALGGLAGADAICQAHADAAGLSGTYRALLSDTATGAAERFVHHGGRYELVDGTLVATDWGDLTYGSIAAPIALTELGGPPPAATVHCNGQVAAWTGTPDFIGPIADWYSTCFDWDVAYPGYSNPFVGSTAATTGAWHKCSSIDDRCDGTAPLFCFEQ